MASLDSVIKENEQKKNRFGYTKEEAQNFPTTKPFFNTEAPSFFPEIPDKAAFVKRILGRDLIEDTPETTTEQPQSFVGNLTKSAGAGTIKMGANAVRIPGAVYNMAQAPYNKMFYDAGLTEGQLTSETNHKFDALNKVANYLDKRSEALSPEELLHDPMYFIEKGDYGGATRNVLLQVANNAPQTVALLAGSAFGLGVPALVGAGLSQSAAIQSRDKNSKDKSAVAMNSVTQGAMEAGLESLGTILPFKYWANIMSKSIGKEPAKKVIANMGKAIVGTFMSESSEEIATSFGQDFSDYIFKDKKSMEGAFGRAMNAGIVGGISGATLVGPGAIAYGARQAEMKPNFLMSPMTKEEVSAVNEAAITGEQPKTKEAENTVLESIFSPNSPSITTDSNPNSLKPVPLPTPTTFIEEEEIPPDSLVKDKITSEVGKVVEKKEDGTSVVDLGKKGKHEVIREDKALSVVKEEPKKEVPLWIKENRPKTLQEFKDNWDKMDARNYKQYLKEFYPSSPAKKYYPEDKYKGMKADFKDNDPVFAGHWGIVKGAGLSKGNVIVGGGSLTNEIEIPVKQLNLIKKPKEFGLIKTNSLDQQLSDLPSPHDPAPPVQIPTASVKPKLFSDEAAQAARERLKEKLKRLHTGIDPTVLQELVIIGGNKIENGVRDLAVWSNEMVKEFGEGVRKYLQKVWEELNSNPKYRVLNINRSGKLIDVYAKEQYEMRELKHEKNKLHIVLNGTIVRYQGDLMQIKGNQPSNAKMLHVFGPAGPIMIPNENVEYVALNTTENLPEYINYTRKLSTWNPAKTTYLGELIASGKLDFNKIKTYVKNKVQNRIDAAYKSKKDLEDTAKLTPKEINQRQKEGFNADVKSLPTILDKQSFKEEIVSRVFIRLMGLSIKKGEESIIHVRTTSKGALVGTQKLDLIINREIGAELVNPIFKNSDYIKVQLSKTGKVNVDRVRAQLIIKLKRVPTWQEVLDVINSEEPNPEKRLDIESFKNMLIASGAYNVSQEHLKAKGVELGQEFSSEKKAEIQSRMQDVLETHGRLSLELGRAPDITEIAEAMGISVFELESAYEDYLKSDTIYIPDSGMVSSHIDQEDAEMSEYSDELRSTFNVSAGFAPIPKGMGENVTKLWSWLRDVSSNVPKTVITVDELVHKWFGLNNYGSLLATWAYEDIKNKIPDKKRRQLIAEAIEDEALRPSLSKEETEVMEFLRNEYERLRLWAKENGIEIAFRDNYVNHIYKKKRNLLSTIYPAGGKTSKIFRFGLERTIADFKKARKLGLEPETDIALLYSVYLNQLYRTVNNKRLIDTLRTLKNEKGLPVLIAQNSKYAENISEEGYVKIIEKAFNTYVYKSSVDKDGKKIPMLELQNVYGDPRIAQVLNELVTPYLPDNRLKRVVINARNIAKWMIMLNPLVHGFNIWTQITNQYNWRIPTIVKAYSQAWSLYKNHDAMIEKMVKQGLNLEGLHNVNNDLYERLNNKFNKDLGYKEAWQRAKGPLGKGWSILKATKNYSDALLWGKIVKLSQIVLWENTVERNKVYNKNITQDQAEKLAAKQINDLMGTLPGYVFSSLEKEFLDVFLFARNWTVSNLRYVTGAMGVGTSGPLKFLQHRGLDKEELKANQIFWMNYLVRSLVYFIISSQLLQWISQAMSGKKPTFMWQNEATHKMDVETGKKDFLGRPVYLVHWMYRDIRDIIGYFTEREKMLVNKAEPILKSSLEAFANHRMFNNEKITEKEGVLAGLERLWYPIVQSSFWRSMETLPVIGFDEREGKRLHPIEGWIQISGAWTRHGLVYPAQTFNTMSERNQMAFLSSLSEPELKDFKEKYSTGLINGSIAHTFMKFRQKLGIDRKELNAKVSSLLQRDKASEAIELMREAGLKDESIKNRLIEWQQRKKNRL